MPSGYENTACVCVRFATSTSLTLDVYVLHLIDFGNGLSQLLGKFPQLLSAWRAKADQLLLLGGKRAQHGDAMGVVWCQTKTHDIFIQCEVRSWK